MRMSAALEFGTIWSTSPPITAEMPSEQLKESGFGKDMSLYALDDYSQIKHVMLGARGAGSAAGRGASRRSD